MECHLRFRWQVDFFLPCGIRTRRAARAADQAPDRRAFASARDRSNGSSNSGSAADHFKVAPLV